ncbi:hypothetical protein [Xanthocytophaga flava]|uniref:hypothetical protein n=1 Tax=Xanthocytophaga flava TaxID=3048013 RepID=UPI0028D36D4E|nr:hypothetical protein [Xanthocytophaga flavus]MDJ1473824.1 hypothetical protein [Xanthocytophaga flavus]
MGHHITAILLKGDYDISLAESFDLLGVRLDNTITMFFIDNYFSAYWQVKLGITGFLDRNDADYLPSENVLAHLMEQISKQKDPIFALIETDYFGGMGKQYANVYRNKVLVDKNIKTINQALAYLGVKRRSKVDEFDTVGLGNYRSNPEYLEKYTDLANELDL